jgi:serine/threonine-protein kinase RsbW
MSSVDPQPSSVPDQATLSVVNDAAAIEAAQARIVSVVERHHYPKASIFAIKLSLHEAISNAFRHGHATLAADVPVRVSYAVTNGKIMLAVEDQGPGFDPGSVPDPTLEENLERGSGRGLLLIRAYMASVRYNASGNRLEMIYERPSA